MKRKRGAAGPPGPMASGAARRRAPASRARASRARAARAARTRAYRVRRRAGGRRGRVPAGWVSRGVLAAVLLAVVFFPVTGPASGQQPSACRGCRAQSASAERWTAKLPGDWAVGAGAAGTGPASGQAYVAVGGGIAAVGEGLTVTVYQLSNGAQLWQATLDAPAGSAISSVRAWPGVVTAGFVAPDGRTRTEVVLDSASGAMIRQYPAAVFGGAVAASAATTVVVGPAGVTSYANATGKVRWQRTTGAGQSWRADGGILYVAESAGGYLGSAPVTSLRVINLGSGAERTLRSPPGRTFSGTLALAADGVVLFTSAAGVTAYSGSTGGVLWSASSAVPEGADSAAQLVYLTVAGGALAGVDPLTGTVRGSVSGATAGGSAGIYVVRGKVALGLDSGPGGEAWGYSMAAARVIWTASGLPWPHYFSDLSGLGGSADESGSTVVVAICAKEAGPGGTPTAQAGTASGSSTATAAGSPATSSPDSSASPSPTVAPVQLCAVPELVALNV
jgi:PQQ-like domain